MSVTRLRYFLYGVAVVMAAGQMQAQEAEDVIDADDFLIRLAPQMEEDSCSVTEGQLAPDINDDKPMPSFISLKDNKIEFNGTDWSDLRQAFIDCTDSENPPVSILHLGDSHIQADGATGVTRRMLQRQFGDAGRGLIVPLRIAGTNEPRDYSFTTSSPHTSSILMRQPWNSDMGSTGCMLTSSGATFTFTVTTGSKNFPSSSFSIIRLLYSGQEPSVTSVDSSNSKVTYSVEPPYEGESGYLDIILDKSVTTATVTFALKGRTHIYGTDLMSDRAGVYYNIIGNNGATYGSYNRIKDMGRGLQALMPDLVIVSLGANEAFGKISDSEFYRTIDNLVKDIKDNNPAADILLVTPMECQKSVYTSQKVKSGKGKKRRTRTVRSRSYTVNQNILRLRNVILRYGRENGIPTYDFYAVAGGNGASGKWLSDGLMSHDRIHNTWSGYELQGRLLYRALMDAISISKQ